MVSGCARLMRHCRENKPYAEGRDVSRKAAKAAKAGTSSILGVLAREDRPDRAIFMVSS